MGYDGVWQLILRGDAIGILVGGSGSATDRGRLSWGFPLGLFGGYLDIVVSLARIIPLRSPAQWQRGPLLGGALALRRRRTRHNESAKGDEEGCAKRLAEGDSIRWDTQTV